jgi:GNAT superfamily N-acetyltransferase
MVTDLPFAQVVDESSHFPSWHFDGDFRNFAGTSGGRSGLHSLDRTVHTISLPASPSPDLRVVELDAESEPLLQRFFEANPFYFETVMGEAPQPTEAREEIHDDLPEGWPYTKKWVIGYVDAQAALVAMATVVSDLLAPSVWHIGLFIVATSRHGGGDSHLLYRSIESWARSSGARWLRLGVVQGNLRAERFWEREGFTQTRLRSGVSMGKLHNTVRVMCKPLAGGSLAQYLAIVPRDRPEAGAVPAK